MATISDLPEVLVGEILSRIQLTALREVRSTCKTWNYLSKTMMFGRENKQFLGFMLKDAKVYSYSLHNDLQGLHNKEEEEVFIDHSIKQVSLRNDILKIVHSDGLLLMCTNTGLTLWNPYLAQIKLIQPMVNDIFHIWDMFALGYENNNNNNNNNNRKHKILRFLDVNDITGQHLALYFEIYDLNSGAWRVLDVDPICDLKRGMSVKGNTYFFAREHRWHIWSPGIVDVFLVCFDFTAERFGPRLALPFSSCHFELNCVFLSCVRDEHLAVLYQHDSVMEIWISSEIELYKVSWSSFLKVELITTSPEIFKAGSFFIEDEKKKVAVVFDVSGTNWGKTSWYNRAYIIGEDGCFKAVKFGDTPNLWTPIKSLHYDPVLLCSYVPSFVQLQIKD